MNDETIILTDQHGRKIRLSAERRAHILEHPELADQFERIRETIEGATLIIATNIDTTVHVYHRYYSTTPVTSKYLLVAVKMAGNDAFVLTAFFSKRQKKGSVIWQT